MPELPEVEITRRRIEPMLVGRRIDRVVTTGASYLFVTPPKAVAARLTGAVVRGLERRGKYLIAQLEDGYGLVIHLGMTGQLFSSEAISPRLLSATARASLAPEAQSRFEPDTHTHLQLSFSDAGPGVYLRDVRKFGKVFLLEPGEVHPRIDRLGVDALEVSGALIFAGTRKRNLAIKAWLLDQSQLAGVGNIYADEALYRAGIRPRRRATRITRKESEALADGLLHVLHRSIDSGGSTISDYVAPDGSEGRYQDERRVYARRGEPCLACETPIKHCVVGQRSTHYCPSCQS
jgi:formamidopyrimidine-DNA glycosylase